jgi:ribonucleotide monophosphatase NagD (HAD superfamily)
MLQSVFAAYRVAPHETALVGDRLYTDMRMARDAGAVAILTLTGETKRSDVESCPAHSQPDLIIENLGELERLLE